MYGPARISRVVIIGNAGGGKSTTGRALSRTLGIELYCIDRLMWKPDWVPTPFEEVERQLQAIMARDRWIIDGWGPGLPERLQAADTIIFIDHPLPVHYWWTLKRRVRRGVPPDAHDRDPVPPLSWGFLKMIWAIHRRGRPHILRLIDSVRDRKHVVHVRSPGALRRLIATLNVER